MPSPPNHPNWYKCDGTNCPTPDGPEYQFPLPEVVGAPVPSKANYDPQNVAWLSEFLGQITGTGTPTLRYENNTPFNPDDDILVVYPGGGPYLPAKQVCRIPSAAQRIYEKKAKKSKLLKLYQDNSPAGIVYFKHTCDDGAGGISNPQTYSELSLGGMELSGFAITSYSKIPQGGVTMTGDSEVQGNYNVVASGGASGDG